LRGVFGAKRDEVTRKWKKLHDEELHESVFLTPYCARDEIEKNEMDGACSSDGERRGVYRGLVVKPGGNNHWGDIGVDGMIILRWIFRNWDVGVWTGSRWLRIETGGRHL
jgi:hypothetical protein